MGAHDRCSISGCGHRRDRGNTGCRFFSYPSNNIAKLMWVKLCGRVGFEVKDIRSTHFVCSCHFVSGQPKRHDSNHVDYLPSLNLPKSVSATELRTNKRPLRPLRMKTATECTGTSKELDIDQQSSSTDSPLAQDTGNYSGSLQHEANRGADCIYTSATLSTSEVNSNNVVVNSNSALMNSKSSSVNSNSDLVISNLSFPLSVSGFLSPQNMPLKQGEGKDGENIQQGSIKEETDCIYSSVSLSTNMNSSISLVNTNSGLVNLNMSFPHLVSGILCPQNMPLKQGEGKGGENIQQGSIKEESDCMYPSVSLFTNMNSNISLVNTNSGLVNSNMSFPRSVSGHLCPQNMPLVLSGKGGDIVKKEAIENTDCMDSSVSLSTCVHSNSGLINSNSVLMNSNCGLVNSSMSCPQLASGISFLQDMRQKHDSGKESEGLQEKASKGTDCDYSGISSSSTVNSVLQCPQSESINLHPQGMPKKQDSGRESKTLKQEAEEVIGSHYAIASLSTSVNSNTEIVNSSNGSSLGYLDIGVVNTPLFQYPTQLPLLVSGVQFPQYLPPNQGAGKESESLQRRAGKLPISRYVRITPLTFTEKFNKWREFGLQKTGGKDNDNRVDHENKNSGKTVNDNDNRVDHENENSGKAEKDNDNRVDHENENSGKAERDFGPHCQCSICHKQVLKVTLKQHHLMHMAPQFQCEVCNKWFRNSGYLACHLRIHAGALPFKCPFCDKRFSSSRARRAHELEHDREKPYKCSVCGSRFTKNFALEVHMAIHSGKRRFRCRDCGKECLTQKCLERHLLVHEIKKQVTCHICGERFVRRRLLKEHLWQHENPGKVPKLAHSAEAKDGHNNIYICDICDKTFPNSFSFQKHMWTHDHVPAADERIENSFECIGCGEKSFTYEGLKKHWLKHVLEIEERDNTGHQKPDCRTLDKSFVCGHCGEKSLTYQELKTHKRIHALKIASVHKKANNGSCDSQTDLRESQFSGEGGEEDGEQDNDHQLPEVAEKHSSCEPLKKSEMDSLKCSICEKQFSRLTELKLHTLTHYDDANCYTCKVCGEVLLDTFQFEKHKLEHSASSDSKISQKIGRSKRKRKLLSN